MSWRPRPLLRIILLWTTLLTGILVWLPLVRGAVEGAAYQWELAAGIGGRGTGGAYWVLLPALGFSFALISAGYRGARPPFHWLLLALHSAFAIAVVREAIVHGDAFRFEGATMGIDIPLQWIAPALFGGFALLVAFWVARDLEPREPRTAPAWAWTRASLIRLALVLAIVPFQIMLLRAPMASGPEQIGVFLTITQWFAIFGVVERAGRPGATPSP